jgi:hypothetical protein
VIRVRGEERLLVPKLVTGMKHWHLRTESDFYPKEHFYKIVKSIPQEAEVRFHSYLTRTPYWVAGDICVRRNRLSGRDSHGS